MVRDFCQPGARFLAGSVALHAVIRAWSPRKGVTGSSVPNATVMAGREKSPKGALNAKELGSCLPAANKRPLWGRLVERSGTDNADGGNPGE